MTVAEAKDELKEIFRSLEAVHIDEECIRHIRSLKDCITRKKRVIISQEKPDSDSKARKNNKPAQNSANSSSKRQRLSGEQVQDYSTDYVYASQPQRDTTSKWKGDGRQ